MSFGYSVGDAVLLTGLAWRTVQNARKACGEYDELTREVTISHIVLGRLERELGSPESLLHKEEGHEELKPILDGCKKVLNTLNIILVKYNVLSEKERSGRRLWQKIRFGNGKVEEVRDQRGQLSYHTQALSLYINIHTVDSMGRVEKQMKESGSDLKDIRIAVNDITAHMLSSGNHHEGSILSTHPTDDKAVWKNFRSELIRDGFRSSLIHKHKDLIKAYIIELSSRGLMDDKDPHSFSMDEINPSVAHKDEGHSKEPSPPKMPRVVDLPSNGDCKPKTKSVENLASGPRPDTGPEDIAQLNGFDATAHVNSSTRGSVS
ncbi:hypothetical protein MMC28_007860 [Mycoblastus sanguinarius]|nr:hypothetical protein [Mycoblastus sanguinarius]